jgi:rSAM/selenodomain-associated transferase 1
VYIAAKAPRAGFVKTRLGATIGHAHAAALYRAFLCDLAIRFANAPFPVGWYVTPPDAWTELAPLVGRRPTLVLAQGAGDWTARQRALFRHAAARGEDRVILVASDSPHLPVSIVAEAFDQLARHDVVLGPTHDGGYYLIGMRGWHDVLGAIPMSTHTVLDDILARARQANVSVKLVAPLFDVDVAADLSALQRVAQVRADLTATLAALTTLRLPEQLSTNVMLVPALEGEMA